MHYLTDTLKYIIEKIIITWQFIVLVFIIIMAPTLKDILNRANDLKFNGFQLSIEANAKVHGLSQDVVNKLQGLSYDDLKIWLIKGGENGDNTFYQINWLTTEQFYKVHRDLDSLGLMKIDMTKTYKDNDGWHIFNTTTPESIKLHKAVLEAIYLNILKVRSNQK